MSEDVLVKWAGLVEIAERYTEPDQARECVRDFAAALRAERARSALYDQVKAVLASTQARVAELETDAALGRMVREMPSHAMEMLADFAHHIWATWTWYLLSHNDQEHQERWRRQATAKYAELSDTEKDSDRDVVRKWLAALEAAQKGEP
jgi:hypothetical protein